MDLNELFLIHLKKGVLKDPDLSVLKACESAFVMETCQRWIWVGSRESIESKKSELSGLISSRAWEAGTVFRFGKNGQIERIGVSEPEIFYGKTAYQFLIQFACGLESEILGETDVFGQFKTAWLAYRTLKTPFGKDLEPWINRILEDTKDIRTQFLQNAGGFSYGSLVRKLLRSSPLVQGPVLLVGAGQIAQSIFPYLADFEVLLTNRNPERLDVLLQSAKGKEDRAFKAVKLQGVHEEKKAWMDAASIILCIPYDDQRDFQRLNWFLTGGIEGRKIIHLGGKRLECGRWSELPRFYALDDLFAIQDSLARARSQQIVSALHACRERAQLREMGASLSICHGWEDLACFA